MQFSIRCHGTMYDVQCTVYTPHDILLVPTCCSTRIENRLAAFQSNYIVFLKSVSEDWPLINSQFVCSIINDCSCQHRNLYILPVEMYRYSIPISCIIFCVSIQIRHSSANKVEGEFSWNQKYILSDTYTFKYVYTWDGIQITNVAWIEIGKCIELWIRVQVICHGYTLHCLFYWSK